MLSETTVSCLLRRRLSWFASTGTRCPPSRFAVSLCDGRAGGVACREHRMSQATTVSVTFSSSATDGEVPEGTAAARPAMVDAPALVDVTWIADGSLLERFFLSRTTLRRTSSSQATCSSRSAPIRPSSPSGAGSLSSATLPRLRVGVVGPRAADPTASVHVDFLISDARRAGCGCPANSRTRRPLSPRRHQSAAETDTGGLDTGQLNGARSAGGAASGSSRRIHTADTIPAITATPALAQSTWS